MKINFPRFTETRFFLILWSMLLVVHLGDTWDQPIAGALAICYFLAALFIRNEKLAWFGSIVPLTIHLMYKWPYNANHLVFVTVCNLYLLTWYFRRTKFNFAEILNFLFLALGMVYLIAAFHKINADYLNPAVSCSNFIFNRFLGRVMIPMNPLSNILPIFSIVMEILIGIGILIPRLRRFAILPSLVFHSVLVWSNFVNFASIPLILYLLFGLNSIKGLNSEKEVKFKKILFIYISVEVAAFLIGIFGYSINGVNISYYLAASIWTITAVSFLWQFLRIRHPLLKPVYHYSFLLFLPLLLVLGSKIYAGLGTSNSFSMFSNIRTEGSGWNHLIVKPEAKVFSFQDEIYFVKDVDPNYMRTVRDFPTPGLGMPELEVYRLYDIWRETAPLPELFTLQKQGDFEAKRAIDLLPPDPSPYSKWEKKFLHFRSIQYSGPNECRW